MFATIIQSNGQQFFSALYYLPPSGTEPRVAAKACYHVYFGQQFAPTKIVTDSHPENESTLAAFRVLDASINRASEGVRVVEDYTRMVLNDQYLSMQLKQLRHDLVTATESLDREKRIAARDSVGDVGRDNRTSSEYQRPGESGVVQANLSRVAQALRTIEEFSKTIDVSVSQAVEQIRYRNYTLEKAILTTMMSAKNLEEHRLYLLLDGRSGPEELKKFAAGMIDSGVDLLQLRDKSLSDRELILAGRALSQAIQGTRAKWIMNDRCDLAIAAGADGVHLGQTDMKVADARRVVGPSRMIGVSTHSLEQARSAVLEGANYIGVGPVFPSQTKQFDEHVGVKLVKSVVAEIQLPTYAIGGIDNDNIVALIEAGCRHVAVSNVILSANDPASATRALRTRLKGD